MFKQSFNELKNLHSLVMIALLCALDVVLGMFSIPLTPTLKIGVAFIAVAVMGYLFGPVPTALCGFLLDFIKYVVAPDGPYFPGFAITEVLAGLIYGIMLYKKDKITIWRCFATRALIDVLLNILLTPLWLNILYGKGYWFYMSSRLLKNLLLWPVESLVLFAVLTAIVKINKQRQLRSGAPVKPE